MIFLKILVKRVKHFLKGPLLECSGPAGPRGGPHAGPHVGPRTASTGPVRETIKPGLVYNHVSLVSTPYMVGVNVSEIDKYRLK